MTHREFTDKLYKTSPVMRMWCKMFNREPYDLAASCGQVKEWEAAQAACEKGK